MTVAAPPVPLDALLVIGFEGPTLPTNVRHWLTDDHLAGVILFRRNLRDIEQAADLIAEIHALRPDDPPLVCLDEEGGPVRRLPAPFPVLPAMRALGRVDDTRLTAKVSQWVGEALWQIGIDMNLAPVADVDTRPDHPVIGPRAFADQPTVVARHVAAYVRGLQSAGVAACAKHFPGHGDSRLDSHLALDRIEHDLERLQHVEWPPFHAAVDAGVAAIMTAHLVCAVLDSHRPASLAPATVAELRDGFGFEGLVLTDDLEMAAVADTYGVGPAAVAAVEAGADLLLIGRQEALQQEALQALHKAWTDGRLPADRLRSAQRQRRSWRDRFACPRPTLPASELTALLQRMADGPLARRLAQLDA